MKNRKFKNYRLVFVFELWFNDNLNGIHESKIPVCNIVGKILRKLPITKIGLIEKTDISEIRYYFVIRNIPMTAYVALVSW